jgi:hypothetical protein
MTEVMLQAIAPARCDLIKIREIGRIFSRAEIAVVVGIEDGRNKVLGLATRTFEAERLLDTASRLRGLGKNRFACRQTASSAPPVPDAPAARFFPRLEDEHQTNRVALKLATPFPSGLSDGKPMCKGITVVDEDRVVTGHSCPACNRRDDPRAARDLRGRFDPPLEQRSNDGFMHERVANLQLAPCRQLRHPGRGAGAAWAAVDGLIAVEHGVAGIGPRNGRSPGPQDVAQAVYGRVFGMNERILRVQCGAQPR